MSAVSLELNLLLFDYFFYFFFLFDSFMSVNSFLLLYYIYLGVGLETPVFLIKNTGTAKGEEVAI